MFIGQLVVLSTGDEVIYTPWFPRSADNVILTYEEIENGTNVTPTVTVFTKRAEEAGAEPGSSIGTFAQLSTTGIFQASVTNVSDLVRMKMSFTSGAKGGVYRYRFMNPVWYATAKV